MLALDTRRATAAACPGSLESSAGRALGFVLDGAVFGCCGEPEALARVGRDLKSWKKLRCLFLFGFLGLWGWGCFYFEKSVPMSNVKWTKYSMKTYLCQ